MKDQYFGDVNDYRKYGLLRALQHDTTLNLLVAWMLTPDDGGTDGGLRRHLHAPERWKHLDPALYDGLASALAPDVPRRVSLIEDSGLLPRASFFSRVVPDARSDRDLWRRALLAAATGAQLVFLDPDNGIEVASKPIGRKDSSKFVAWNEIQDLWDAGHSLLIYQHFRRARRNDFTRQMVADLRSRTRAGLVEAFRTPHVLFLLAAQPQHEAPLLGGLARVAASWKGQIDVMGFSTG